MPKKTPATPPKAKAAMPKKTLAIPPEAKAPASAAKAAASAAKAAASAPKPDAEIVLRTVVFGVNRTVRVPDPIAFCQGAGVRANLLTALKRELEGTCCQRMYVHQVLDPGKAGPLVAQPDSLEGVYQIDAIGARVRGWVARKREIVLGRITMRRGGMTFVEGDAPTRFVANLMDETGSVSAARAGECPNGTLLPLTLGALQYQPQERFAVGTAVLCAPARGSLTVQLVGSLTDEAAEQLAPLVELLHDTPVTADERYFADLLGVRVDSQKSGGPRLDIRAIVNGSAGRDVSGIWVCDATLTAVCLGASAGAGHAGAGAGTSAGAGAGTILPTLRADEFCDFVVRRALSHRLVITELAREYADPKKRATAAPVWREMVRLASAGASTTKGSR